MNPKLFATCLLGLAACRSTAAPDPAKPARSTLAVASYANAVATDASRDLLRPGRVVLVGEIHGTQEFPALFAALVDRALALDLPVTVALEMKSTEQGALDAFTQSPTPPSCPAGNHWRPSTADGRTSLAMLDLVRWLGERARKTGRVRLLAIDKANGGNRELAMASSIATEVDANPSRVVLALTGNGHSRLRMGLLEGEYDDPTYEPMGYRLAKRGLPVSLVSISHPSGKAWFCTESMDCSAHDTTSVPSEGGPPELHAVARPREDGATFEVSLRELHASPPANCQ